MPEATRTELLDELKQTMLSCMTDHLQDNFEQGALFSIEVAKKVAAQVEAKLEGAHQDDVDELKALLTSGSEDLKPFIDFMAETKALIDGDETAEGFQIFATLLADVKAVKELAQAQGVTITSMGELLSTHTEKLATHTQQIAGLQSDVNDLKNATPVTGEADCEKCIDEMIALNNATWSAVCDSVKGVNDAFMASRKTALLATLDPAPVTAEVDGAARGI